MSISFIKSEKQYRKLFLAGIVNGIGDRFSSVAVLAMLLQLTGSGLAIGITLAIRVIPSLFFGPIGGWLADRFPRKIILISTDLIRIAFALSFLFVKSEQDIWIIYLSSFMLAAGEAIYAPTRKSAIPRLVDRDYLVKVNSFEQVMLGIVLIIGALSGGVVSFIFGPYVTYWLNAASFLGSAAIIFTIVFPENIEVKVNNATKKKNLFSVFKKVILISVPVQILLFCEILIASINGLDNVLISIYAIRVYHLGDVGVGLFYGALGIGLMLSFSVANQLRRNLLISGLICLLLEGIFHVILSRTHLVIFAFLMFCGAAFMSGICNACFDTILMKEIDQQHQGTMFGLLATISNTILGISMFIAGFALKYLDPRTLGLIGGIAYMIIAILILSTISMKFYRKRGTI
ncbi:MFS transporter [Bacillus sp. EAC]|uniref:MFS transporter n=1 Tax=Bacillus sp. EAC TaxID=1978338 RepID=UPI000B44614D|nr:MFS transporter [Bacillus sp. EAC]